MPVVEALVEHGVSGWLVQPDDPAALAEGLHWVLGDVKLAEKLSRNGLTVVEPSPGTGRWKNCWRYIES